MRNNILKLNPYRLGLDQLDLNRVNLALYSVWGTGSVPNQSYSTELIRDPTKAHYSWKGQFKKKT